MKAWVHSGSHSKGEVHSGSPSTSMGSQWFTAKETASQRFPVNGQGFTVVRRVISKMLAFKVHIRPQLGGARYARAPQLGRNENVLPGAHAAAYGRGNTCAHLLLVTVVAGAVEVTVPANGGVSYRSVPCHDGVPGRRTADAAELYQKAFTHDTAIANACVIAYAFACTCAYACARVY